MTGTIAVEIGSKRHTFNRDRLATAILLRLDHPDDARAVVEALEGDHGVPHGEAIGLAIAAQKCIGLGIDP